MRRLMLATAIAIAALGCGAWVAAQVCEPTAIGAFEEGWASEVALGGGYAYVADGPFGVRVLDVSNPAVPSEVASYDTAGEVRGVALRGDLLCVADADGGFRVLDVTNPAAPVEVGQLPMPSTAEDVDLSGTLALVADSFAGLRLVDISTPSAPVEVGSYAPPDFAAVTVTVAGSHALVGAADLGLSIVDISTPSAPVEIGRFDTAGEAGNVAVEGSLAFVADGTRGLQIVDVSDPAAPAWVASFATSDDLHDVAVRDGVAYLACENGGFEVLNVSDPTAPVEMGSWQTAGPAFGLAVEDHVAWVSELVWGLEVVDVSSCTLAPEQHTYLVPAVAHNPGLGGTLWRTDVGVASRASSPAELTLTLRARGAEPVVQTATLAPGAALEWGNILETVFDTDASASVAGSVQVDSSQPLFLAARTYNSTAAGTYGQYLPAITRAQALTPGRVGVLPQLKSDAGYRTNLGVVNVGSVSATVLLTLYDASGAALGTLDIDVEPGEWSQRTNVFDAAGTGTQHVGYATAEVSSATGEVWVYASVVDNQTGDPTTIPMLTALAGEVQRAARLARSSPYAGSWSGTTSQGLPLSFQVSEDGMVEAFRMGLRLNLFTATCTGDATPVGPFLLDGDQLHATVLFPDNASITSEVSGTFTSADAASGGYTGYSESANVICDGNVFWVAGGQLEPGTWTAGRTGALTASAVADVTTGAAPLEVAFTGSAVGGVPPYAYVWDFGDGSPVASVQSPTHTYTEAGVYDVDLTVSDASLQQAAAGLTVTVTAGPAAYRYLIPAVAHNPGLGGTLWRTDVGATNRTADAASLSLTFHSPGVAPVERTDVLAAGAAVEWANIVETVFTVGVADNASGSVEVAADVPLFMAARTYNATAAGTYGQYLPALTEADAITPGVVAVLPQLKRTVSFRTNVGAVNLGTAAATVALTFYDAAAGSIGSATVDVAPAEWAQLSDVFNRIGVPEADVSYATVEVTTAGGEVWVYASVVDNLTGDPTTVPALRPE